MVSGTDTVLARVRDIVFTVLGPDFATVYLFGSSAGGKKHRLSDIDIAIDPARPLPAGVLPRLREALEESTIPCHVDVVDLRDVDPIFRQRVRKEGVVWPASDNA